MSLTNMFMHCIALHIDIEISYIIISDAVKFYANILEALKVLKAS